MLYRVTFDISFDNSIKTGSFSGFIVRGIVYNMLKRIDESLFRQVHDSKTIAPFSCTPLYTCEGRIMWYYVPKGAHSFQVILLDENLQHRFLLELQKNRSLWEIDYYGYRARIQTSSIEQINLSFSRENSCDYRQLHVKFLSPTFFRRQYPYIPQKYAKEYKIRLRKKPRSLVYPFPDPQLLFNNIVRIWEKYAPAKPGSLEKFRDWIDCGGLAVSEHRLKTVKVIEHKTTNKYQRGFIGYAKLTATENNSEMLRIAHILLKFAEVVGVGGCRTAGFGRIRVEVL